MSVSEQPSSRGATSWPGPAGCGVGGEAESRAAARPRPRRRGSLLAVAGCVATLAGCGGGQEGDRKSDPFAAISQKSAATNRPAHAAPRWEHVSTFEGSGAATKDFVVAGKAIQWRARWTCESGDLGLSVTPPPADGRALAEARCPGDGEESSIATGRLRLAIKASSRWRVVIEQQVDTPLHEPPLAGMTDDRLVARGGFYPIDKPSSGIASVYRLPNGRLGLRLEDFRTSPNTDLFVWLSPARNVKTTKDAFRAPHTVLREVKSTMGDQNYVLPRSVDANELRTIIMWCEPVRNAYTAAALRAAGLGR